MRPAVRNGGMGMMATTVADPTYLMGRSAHERQRLREQGDMLRPGTERIFREAGLAPGMRVLDVGCGVGDVSLLAADLVGETGSVVGVDRDPAVLARAQERVAQLGRANITFVEGDYRELPPGEPFDAVVGRATLMYAGDPVEAVRSLLPQVRSGGLVAFVEPDYTSRAVLPPLQIYDKIADWWLETLCHAGIDWQMGLKLFPVFVAAGLPGPEMRTDRAIGGGPDFFGYAAAAGVVRSILPLLERFGIATAEEVDIDTLEDRFRAETVAGGGVVALPMFVGAWSRKP